MLANIDASGGSSTVAANINLVAINSLRAIRAVATAAAGSVPSSNVIIQANTTYPIAFAVPGSNNVAVGTLFQGTAAAVGTANVFQFANGSGLNANSTVVAANNGTLTTATITALASVNAASVSINVASGNTTGGLVFINAGTPTAQTIANGMLLYISGTPSGAGAITNFANGYFLVQNVVTGNTTFQIAYPNGSPVATTGANNAVGGLTFQYGYMTVTAGTTIYPGQGISSSVPPTSIVAQQSGTTAGAGVYVLSWPGPYPTATASGTANGFATSQSQSTPSYYGNIMAGNGAATGLTAANTTGLFTFPTAHNLMVGQAVVMTNTAPATGVTIPAASGTTYYVIATPNNTSFQLSATFNGAGVTTAAASAAAGTLMIPLPVPLNMVQYGTNNMITVIANTDAGGWSLDSNNNLNDFMSVSSGGIVTSTGTAGTILDLYNSNSTNKTTYPYHKISIIPGPTVNASTASTANCYLIYHGASAYTGFANINAGTTLSFNGNTTISTIPTTGASAVGGTQQPTGPSAQVNQRGTYVAANPYNWQIGDYQYTIACNNQYMHIISNSSIVSMGLRDSQVWEDNFPDNPPVYNFSVDTRTQGSSNYYPSSLFTWMRTISNNATINPPAHYRNTITTVVSTGTLAINPVTGMTSNTYALANGSNFDAAYVRNRTPMAGIFNLSSHIYSTTAAVPYIGYAPVYDPTTTAFVPPAYPIMIQMQVPGSYNSGGKAKGIYKSLSSAANGTAAGANLVISTFYTAGATYTVDGDPYYPVATGAGGMDLFLVRRV